MTETRTIHHEENPISLRSAFVLDDGYVVTFQLLPCWLTSDLPGPREYGKSDFTYLYRRRRSFFDRVTLAPLGCTQTKTFRWSFRFGEKRCFWRLVGHLGYRRLCISLEDDIRVMEFSKPPVIKLQWSDSGHSVALFLEGQSWAFIHEEKNQGYSKGVLKPTIGNTWDQNLFAQTFLAR